MASGDPGTADGWIKERFFQDGCVSARALATGAVQAAELDADSVTTVKILDLNVTTGKLANLAVTEGKIAALAVTEGKIADNAVTLAKLDDFTAQGYALRGGALGAPEEFDASTVGNLLMGDGTDLVSLPLSGAATVDATGVLTMTNPQAYDPGSVPMNTLYYAGDVVEAEQVTIGADVYEYEVVNTDSTDNAGGTVDDFNNVTDPLVVTMSAVLYPALGVGGTDALVLGRLIRLENEILRVTDITGDDITFARGVSNTTAATHVDTTDIYVDDGSALQAGTTIRTGIVATLTPTVATDALVADINVVGTETVLATGPSNSEVLVRLADGVGGTAIAGTSAIATTDTLSAIGSGWYQATLVGGRAAGLKRFAVQQRTMVASEATFGIARFSFPFTPTIALVSGYGATGILALGTGVTISGGVVTISNDGGGDFANTDVITVLAIE